MITIYRPDKKPRTSKNLRGIYAYSRESAVKYVVAIRTVGGCGTLTVVWEDGARCTTEFASYNIMHDWVRDARMFRNVHATNKINAGNGLPAKEAS